MKILTNHFSPLQKRTQPGSKRKSEVSMQGELWFIRGTYINFTNMELTCEVLFGHSQEWGGDALNLILYKFKAYFIFNLFPPVNLWHPFQSSCVNCASQCLK